MAGLTGVYSSLCDAKGELLKFPRSVVRGPQEIYATESLRPRHSLRIRRSVLRSPGPQEILFTIAQSISSPPCVLGYLQCESNFTSKVVSSTAVSHKRSASHLFHQDRVWLYLRPVYIVYIVDC
uniref:(California timema) hypothetical protein n=1 Tax=Timema californicum TaxID=61474 RepID=A0A7R9JC40_TIMCA|nr:unnamed protein product [Timema californicum]